MRRDLHVVEPICYLGRQELGRSQAPQLEAVRALKRKLVLKEISKPLGKKLRMVK
jgi:hypothetical protein